MAALVASTIRTPGGSGGTTVAIDTTGASLILISLAYYSGTPGISDNKGNTYTALTARASGNTTHKYFYKIGGVVGAGHTFTVANAYYAAIRVVAFSGVIGFQMEAGATSVVSPITLGPVTPSQHYSLIVTSLGSETVATDSIAPATFTLVGSVQWANGVNMGESLAYYIQPTSAPISPVWSWVGTHTAGAAAVAVFSALDPVVRVAVTETLLVGDRSSQPSYKLGLALSESLAVTDVLAVTCRTRGPIRVRGTGKVLGSGARLTVTVPTPPAVGNGLIVPVVSTGSITATDNWGNTYQLACSTTDTLHVIYVFTCPRITATGSPFTITLTNTSSVNWLTSAIEVEGVGPGGLALDRFTGPQSYWGTSAAPTTGLTAALTHDRILEVGVVGFGNSLSFCTVEAGSPPWLEEWEQFSTPLTGEVDTRSVDGVYGTSRAANWTVNQALVNVTMIAVFKASTPPLTVNVMEALRVSVHTSLPTFSFGPASRENPVVVSDIPAPRLASHEISRVQSTGKVVPGSVSKFTVSFLTPPTVGHGVIVLVNGSMSLSNQTNVGSWTCEDNYGNTYVTGALSTGGSSRYCSAIYYCRKVTATGPAFTITVWPDRNTYFLGNAIEVSGVGGGLMVDRFITATGTTTPTLSVGPTLPLQVRRAFMVGLLNVGAAQGSITASTATPSWTQEFEELGATNAVGEADSRLVPEALGTTQDLSWTVTSGSVIYTAALVAFSAGALPLVAVDTIRVVDRQSMPAFSLGVQFDEAATVVDVAVVALVSQGPARVQGTGKVSSSGWYPTATFPAPPTKGNGIVVLMSGFSIAVAAVTDSQGNAYHFAGSVINGSLSTWIYYCPEIRGIVPAPLTVYADLTDSGYWSMSAVEVTGLQRGLLAVEAVKTATGSGTAVSTGATTALTASRVFLAAVQANSANQASITVEALTPPWTQEHEELSYGSYVGAEGDTRPLSGAIGATPTANWTNATSTAWAATLVVFKVIPGPPPSWGAFARVQGSGLQYIDQKSVFPLTMPTPPALGNAVIVLVSASVSGGHDGSAATCRDNWGNSYYRAAVCSSASTYQDCYIWYCPRVTVTGSPFTVTVTPVGSIWMIGSLTEFSGSGEGLVLLQTAIRTGNAYGPETPATVGPLTPLTGSEALLAASLDLGGQQDAITIVEAGWLEEYENGGDPHCYGEGNTQILTGAAGAAPGVSWEITDDTGFVAALAAFGPSALAVSVSESMVLGDSQSMPVFHFGLVPGDDLHVQDAATFDISYVPAVVGAPYLFWGSEINYWQYTASAYGVPFFVTLAWSRGGSAYPPLTITFDGDPLRRVYRTEESPNSFIDTYVLDDPGVRLDRILEFFGEYYGPPVGTQQKYDFYGVVLSLQSGHSVRASYQNEPVYLSKSGISYPVPNALGDLVVDWCDAYTTYGPAYFTAGPGQTQFYDIAYRAGSYRSGLVAPTTLRWDVDHDPNDDGDFYHYITVFARSGLLTPYETVKVKEQAHPAAPQREGVGAYLFNADLEGLTRTTAITSGSSDYTVAGWVLPTIIGIVNYRTLFAQIEDAAGEYFAWAGVWSEYDDGQDWIVLDVGDGGESLGTVRVAITPNRSYRWAYVREGTVHRLYLDGTLIGTITADLSFTVFDGLYVGSDGQSGSSHFTIAYLREWSAALTPSELLVEWNQLAAQRSTGLVSDAPLQKHLNDVSGAGRHWSAVGAVLPVPFGPLVANITTALARTSALTEMRFLHQSGGGYVGVHVALRGATRTSLVAYGAAMLTRVSRTSAGNYAVEWWAGSAPPGAAYVNVIVDAACDMAIAVYDLPYSPPREVTAITGSNAAPAITIAAPALGEAGVDVMVQDERQNLYLPGTGQTTLVNQGQVVEATTFTRIGSSIEPATRRSLVWTLTVADLWSISGFSIPPAGAMAPVATVTTLGKTAGTATSLTISHASDGNPLYVHVAFGAAARTATAVTFNSVGLTRLWRGTGAAWAHEVWYLSAPATATANVVITADATNQHAAAVHNVSGGLVGWQGSLASGGSGTAVTHAVTANLNDLVLDLVASDATGQTFTTGSAGQTRLAQQVEANTHVKVAAGSAAVQLGLPAGAIPLTWSTPYTIGWAETALLLRSSALAVLVSEFTGIREELTRRVNKLTVVAVDLVRVGDRPQPVKGMPFREAWDDGVVHDALLTDPTLLPTGEDPYWTEGMPFTALLDPPLHLELDIAEPIRTRSGAAPMTASKAPARSGQAGEDPEVFDVVTARIPFLGLRRNEPLTVTDVAMPKRRYPTTGVRFEDQSNLHGDFLPASGPFTVALWCWPDVLDFSGVILTLGNDYNLLSCSKTGAFYETIAFRVTLRFVPSSPGPPPVTAHYEYLVSGDYPRQAWYFLGLVREPGPTPEAFGTETLYIFDEEFHLLEMLTGNVEAGNPVSFTVGGGGDVTGADFRGQGTLGNLLIYNVVVEGSILAQLSANYVPSNTDGLVAWYPLTSHLKLGDASGNGNLLLPEGLLTTSPVGEGPQIPGSGGFADLFRDVSDTSSVTELARMTTSPMTVVMSESVNAHESERGAAFEPGKEPRFVDVREAIRVSEVRTVVRRSLLKRAVFDKVFNYDVPSRRVYTRTKTEVALVRADFLKARDGVKAQMYIGGGIYARVSESVTVVQSDMYMGHPPRHPGPPGIPETDVIGVGPNPGLPAAGLGLDYWVSGVDEFVE